jgi:hypothetical protein
MAMLVMAMPAMVPMVPMAMPMPVMGRMAMGAGPHALLIAVAAGLIGDL